MPNVSNILSYIEHIASIAAAGAIIYTAWVGRLQLGEWKKEKLLDRRAKHAEKVVKLIHRAKDAIFDARHPYLGTKGKEEAKERLMNFGYSEHEIDENSILVYTICVSKRIEKSSEIFIKIFNYAPILNIVFDSSIASDLKDLYKIYRKISYLDVSKIRIMSRLKKKNFDNLGPVRRRLNDDDDVSVEVNNLVERIESKIQEIIGKIDD